MDMMSSKFTVAFTNTPGAVKPLYFLSKKTGKKLYCVRSQTYVMTSGIVGFAVVVQSWVSSFRVCVTSDDGLVDAELNRRICDLIEENIENEKIRTKNMPILGVEVPNKEKFETKKDQ